MAGFVETEKQVGSSTMRVGAFSYGEKNIVVRQWGEGANQITGKFCSIAGGITVMLGGNHRTDWITTFPFGKIYKRALGNTHIEGHPATKGDVVVGDDVWLGQNAVIMSGVTIGSGAVVAAHAVVSKDVPPYTIAAGNPAQNVRQRFPGEIVELLLHLRWWDLDVAAIREIAPMLSQAPTRENIQQLIDRFRREEGGD